MCMDFGERVRRAVLDSGLKQNELADRIGITPAAVNNWLNRGAKDLRADVLFALAAAAGKSPRWIATGEGPEMADAAPNDGTDVPVIEFPTLADVGIREDAQPAKMAVSWTICPVKHGSRTFAFKMPDNSMACATDQSIPAGHYVWIDPDQSAAAHDSPVLARLESGQHLVAQFMEQAGRRWLHLLNPAYPPVPPGTAFEVVGRVIFSGRER